MTSNILNAGTFEHYIDQFNRDDREQKNLYITNQKTWDFLSANIPLLECSDASFESTYYYRWWMYRKHVYQENSKFRVSELLLDNKRYPTWFAAGHNIFEGRWLHDSRIINDFTSFWMIEQPKLRHYSDWVASAIWTSFLVNGNEKHLAEMFDSMIREYLIWEQKHKCQNGLFHSVDDDDGGEITIGGSGGKEIRGSSDRRPSINSFMYSYCEAIYKTAEILGKNSEAKIYREKAETLRDNINRELWDSDDDFYKVVKYDTDRNGVKQFADVKEQIGYVPWYFNIPDSGREKAWLELLDSNGFHAPFGPTTAERRHPDYAVRYTGHECQWCGPSWPSQTCITLNGMANLLNNYDQNLITKKQYFSLLSIYTKSHQRTTAEGKIIHWIDEDIDPDTGLWLSGYRRSGNTEDGWFEKSWRDYNHSTYCDLIITGLAGLRPRKDNILEINPLLPNDTGWDYFCLDNIKYHDHIITILWDRIGTRYGLGEGLKVFVDGSEVGKSATLSALTVDISQ